MATAEKYIPWGKVGGILAMVYYSLTCLFGAIFIYGPILPLMWLWPWLYRRLVEVLSSMWQAVLVAVIEKFFRVKVRLTGDEIRRHEKTLVLMNHPTRLDWLYFFIPIFHFAVLNRQKITLKAPLKWMPGIGWAMQVAGYIFLEREWEKDKKHMTEMLHHLFTLRSKPNYLLFAEGTDLSPSNKKRSQQFAVKNDLEVYNHVLHPRTTGFVHMVNTLRAAGEIDSIHDVTVAYPYTMPTTEIALVLGEYPPEVHFNITRYNIKDLPEDDEELSDWCKKIWREKEYLLRDFYEGKSDGDGNKHFKNVKQPKTHSRNLSQWAAIIGWSLEVIVSIWLLLNFPIARWYALMTILFYVSVGYAFGGVEKLELFVASTLREMRGEPSKLRAPKTDGNYYKEFIDKHK